MANKCRKCGATINSKWKTLCYKCYHQQKGDYKPRKLQKRFGGTK
jgi:NMD protein affecting ribosome stability and mRNA decay